MVVTKNGNLISDFRLQRLLAEIRNALACWLFGVTTNTTFSVVKLNYCLRDITLNLTVIASFFNRQPIAMNCILVKLTLSLTFVVFF